MSYAPSATSSAPSASPLATVFGWATRAETWLDARGRWAWVATLVAGFVIAPPVGILILGYLIWSKRMFGSCCTSRRAERRANAWAQRANAGRPSGNSAFDAYKAETLRRLDEEQQAFDAFLTRLREARDKHEFDQFMAEHAAASSATSRNADADAAHGETAEGSNRRVPGQY